ncbi:hypothetical protein LFL96_09100 [Paraburkholderia sp. D15]|uniref:hypothetical protein n=1 Tax=Paraburkholderia sp. D15 TaxID=2880218 RepID=UPI002479B339|nr:hypothetical protein [Paraburkholderia sp. D15]WGS51635.1 hypothetical protein LFL96_09100 [Paraburkholderia sp. D15]WKF55837.1 hypothetical protein HUO10_000281 [Paraburkholderia busanensis]
MNKTKYYVRSGRVGASAPLYVLLGGGIGVAIVAALYAVVIRYNPFIYFSFLATLLFGGLIGFIAVQASQAGKSRSLPFDLFAALLLSAFGLWAYWLIWIVLELDHGAHVAGELVFAGPATWGDFLNWLAENYHVTVSRYIGTHGAQASTDNMRWIWAGEALLVMLAAQLLAWTSSGVRIFSERTGKWAETTLKADVQGIDGEPGALREAFERGDFSALMPLARIDPQAYRLETAWRNVDLELIAEPSDDTFRAITVRTVVNRWDKKGKRKQTRTTVVEHLWIAPRDYDALLTRLAVAETPALPA